MRNFVAGLLAVAGLVVLARPALAVETVAPLKVCLVSGSLEYKSNESLAQFQTFLESRYKAECSRAFVEGENISNLPGLENLDTCDVMLLFTRRLKLEGEQLERFKRYCLAGRPIVGVRTASHAVQSWLELDKEVLGGNYHSHYSSKDETEVRVVESAKDHPLLKGVAGWRSAGSLYKNEGLASDNLILMTGQNSEATEPVTWARTYKGARIFYTALGHPQDFEEASFKNLLVNALFWTVGRAPASR